MYRFNGKILQNKNELDYKPGLMCRNLHLFCLKVSFVSSLGNEKGKGTNEDSMMTLAFLGRHKKADQIMLCRLFRAVLFSQIRGILKSGL